MRQGLAEPQSNWRTRRLDGRTSTRSIGLRSGEGQTAATIVLALLRGVAIHHSDPFLTPILRLGPGSGSVAPVGAGLNIHRMAENRERRLVPQSRERISLQVDSRQIRGRCYCAPG